MSAVMIYLIPLQCGVKTIIEVVGLGPEIQITMKIEVWEYTARVLIPARL